MNQLLDRHSKTNRLSPYIPPWLPSGVLYGLSFPSWETLNLAPLAWIALTFLLVPQIVHQKPACYFLSALLFGLTGSLIAGYWTMKYSIALGVIAVVWHAFIVATPLWIFRYLVLFYGYRKSLVLLPFIWTGWEWFAASFQPFFWGALGSTQSNINLIIQFTDITGVWGLSFWLISLNAIVAYFWGQLSSKNIWQIISKIIFLFFILIIPVVIYGQWRLVNLNPTVSKKLNVLIVQSGDVYWEGWRNIKKIMNAANSEKIDLAVWPESIFTGMPFYDKDFTENFNQWKFAVMMVFIGSQRNLERIDSIDPYGASIILDKSTLHRLQLGPETTIQEPHYRKQRLVPYAELQLIPDTILSHFPALEIFTPERMQNPKQRSNPLVFKNGMTSHLIAPLLCYEVIFPDLSGYAVKNGAEALFVMANDLQFGAAETWQAASFAQLRAVETRRPVVRTSTGGVVGVIDIRGQWIFKNSLQETRGFHVSVDLIKNYQTFYVQWIDWFPKICLVISVILMTMFHLNTHPYRSKHNPTP